VVHTGRVISSDGYDDGVLAFFFLRVLLPRVDWILIRTFLLSLYYLPMGVNFFFLNSGK